MWIGISGKARSGKNTVACYLSNKLSIPVVALATPLYQLSNDFDLAESKKESDQFYIAYQHLSKWSSTGASVPNRIGVASQLAYFSIKYPTISTKNVPRLIAIGEYMRSLDPLFWTKLLFSQHEEGIVADIRQVGEAQAISSKGGKLIRVDSYLSKRQERANVLGETLPSDSSPTENALDSYQSFNFYISNNSNQDYLENKLDMLLDCLSTIVENSV